MFKLVRQNLEGLGGVLIPCKLWEIFLQFSLLILFSDQEDFSRELSKNMTSNKKGTDITHSYSL